MVSFPRHSVFQFALEKWQQHEPIAAALVTDAWENPRY